LSDGARQRRALLVEVGWVFGASVVVIAALDLLAGPGLGAWVPLLAAAVFVGAPLWVARRRRDAPDALGSGPIGPALRWAALSVVALAAVFPLGFHVWHAGVQGQTAEVAWSNYARWPAKAEGRPADLSAPGVYVWAQGAGLFIWCERAPEAVIELTSLYAGPWTARERGAVTVTTPTPSSPNSPLKAPSTARCPPSRGGLDLLLSGHDGGGEPARLTLRVNAPLRVGVDPSPRPLGADGWASVALEVSAWWVLWLLMEQLLLVAFPEEIFYRGYVQPTLAEALGGRGGRGLAVVLVVTSALFALGHVAVFWHWTRLMVFFPSLAFGWLRARTGGVLAPAVFHAACNCAVELARVHYT
jgi:membrane protease YdiL (CAAX protease family)